MTRPGLATLSQGPVSSDSTEFRHIIRVHLVSKRRSERRELDNAIVAIIPMSALPAAVAGHGKRRPDDADAASHSQTKSP